MPNGHDENVKEANRRAGWEAGNRRSNISSDADVAKGQRYVQDAGFMQDSRDIARKQAVLAGAFQKTGIPKMHKGGVVPASGIYSLKKGEKVIAPGMKNGFQAMEKRLATKGPIAKVSATSRAMKTTWNKSGKKNFGRAI